MRCKGVASRRCLSAALCHASQGLSLDAAVHIPAHDCSALEHFLKCLGALVLGSRLRMRIGSPN